MYCEKCGSKLNGNEQYCPNCGFKLFKQGVTFASMRCKDCNGTMAVDPDNKFIICPYCGSKKLMIESDYVKVETIKSNDSRKAKETASFYDYKKKEVEGKWDNLSEIVLICAAVIILLLISGK